MLRFHHLRSSHDLSCAEIAGGARRSERHDVLLDQTKHIELYARPGEGEFLLITFAPKFYVAENGRFWGHTLAEQLHCPCLAFVSKNPTWYPADEMRVLAKAVRPHTSSRKRIINYGASMGGYAAIKYARLMNATTTIAMSPQYSIDPADVPFDPRYKSFFNKALHDRMRIKPEDCTGRIFVIADPWLESDKGNVALIGAASHCAVTVPAFMSDHNTVILFRSSRRVRSLFEAAEENDVRKIRNLIREGGKSMPQIRMRAAIDISTPTNPGRAERLLNGWEDQLLSDKTWRYSVFQMRRKIADQFFARKDWRSAARNALSGIFIEPDNAHLLEMLGQILFELGENDAALAWLKRSIAADPGRASPHHRVAKHLARTGNYPAAIEAAELAVRCSKDHPVMMQSLSEIHERSGNLAQATAWSTRAALGAPGNVWLQIFASRLLVRSKDNAGATRFLRCAEDTPDAQLPQVLAAINDLRQQLGETAAPALPAP